MLMCVCYLRLGDRLEKRSCGALLSVATRTSSSSSMISAATAPEFVLPPDVAGNVEAAGPFSFLPPLLLSATALGMKSEPNPLAAGCFEASSAPPFRRYGSSSPTTAAFALALGCCSAASRGAADSGFAGAARFAAPAVHAADGRPSIFVEHRPQGAIACLAAALCERNLFTRVRILLEHNHHDLLLLIDLLHFHLVHCTTAFGDVAASPTQLYPLWQRFRWDPALARTATLTLLALLEPQDFVQLQQVAIQPR
eukprot:CAMPEP_0178445224 /NCGR_PEP_ID=MMETSP0689_2-20121128/40025_1 /TAXON_ID=160604 /ORGANISM="Amphidinium massartii, Strain CS-259" /LENGTH=253 /DNA_ID=CAMNT_0020069705 /DNA_START=1 /DNA_END=759 /DNA_ORIENTATION=+